MNLPTRLRALLLALFAALSLAACNNDKPAECSQNAPCGAFASCVDGQCVAKSCGTSTDCGMQSFCEAGECQPGCQSGDDCYPDEVCDPSTATCAAAACRDTSLDCGFKEFCDPAAGDCYEASGYYCSDCRNDEDCGGNGNICLNFGAPGQFCGVTCDTNVDCPSGFECLPVSDGNGNIISNQCLTYCWLYIDDARGPAAPATGELPALRPTPVGADATASETCP